ncbi:MAG: hypothetical protein LBC35_01025 [Coriobacteriales bacterium]|jgi:hypothetical protein|nr:hypothetical protein [Coriobacteriales bacterium]
MPKNLNPMPGTVSATNQADSLAAATAAGTVPNGGASLPLPQARQFKPVSNLQATIITILLACVLIVSAAGLVMDILSINRTASMGGGNFNSSGGERTMPEGMPGFDSEDAGTGASGGSSTGA